MAEPSASGTLPRLVGVRLHSRRGSGGTPAEARIQALLDLPAAAARRAGDDDALRQLAVAARRAVETLPETVQSRLDEVAALAVELGLEVAREVVGAALDRGLFDPAPIVARCLADCVHGSDRADLVVKLHPDDLGAVTARLTAMPDIAAELGGARLVGDPAVPRGGVRAETGAGRLHYDPREALERIAAELRREVRG